MKPLAILALATGLFLATAAPAADEDKVTIQTAKLKQILDQVASHKGKYVLVDFWGDFCIPCKKEFPNLVRLHREQAKNGLVCMSVAVDQDEEDKENCLKFLKAQKATLTNFWINEAPEAWQTHFGFTAVPAVVVYGPDGKIVKKFTFDDPNDQFTYKDVEAYLLPLLKK